MEGAAYERSSEPAKAHPLRAHTVVTLHSSVTTTASCCRAIHWDAYGEWTDGQQRQERNETRKSTRGDTAKTSLHGDGGCLTITSIPLLVCCVMCCLFLIAETTTRSDYVESLQFLATRESLPCTLLGRVSTIPRYRVLSGLPGRAEQLSKVYSSGSDCSVVCETDG